MHDTTGDLVYGGETVAVASDTGMRIKQKHVRGRRGAGPGDLTQRQCRVGEEIRHILAGLLLRGDVYDPDLARVSITLCEVSVSADFSHAKVYFTPTANTSGTSGNNGASAVTVCNPDAVLAGLARIQPALQHQLSKQLTTNRCPRLRFVLDRRFEVAGRIDALIAQNRA